MLHGKATLFTLVFAAAIGAAAAAFSGCTTLLGDFEIAASTGEGGTGSKTNGDVCQTGPECGSGFCSDGVCCESACSGTCESCNIDKGKCVAVPDGQDPDKECKPEVRPDAGIPEQDAASIPDSGSLDGGAGDAEAEQEDGGKVNVPDAGFTSSDDKCAGSCNGNRACKFPGVETTCGTKFCNTATEAARFACDGKGYCELGREMCKSFSCENDECRKSCAEQNDCLGTHFCNQQGTCQEKLADGLGCGNPDQCRSGFCVTEGGGAGVCCNSECDPAKGIPGATCKAPGKVGKCQCTEACGTGSCRLFYADSDGDGYGDKNGVAPTTAKVGCDNAPPPVGFSASKDDCDDGDNRAHPGQTGYFPDTTLGKGLNDFNCDGVITKEIKEYPGATCYECGAPKTCKPSTVCSSRSTAQSRLTCDLYAGPIFCLPGQTCPAYTCGYGSKVSNTAGFTTTVPCGTTSPTYKTCGTCSGGTIGGAPSSTTSSRQQRCR